MKKPIRWTVWACALPALVAAAAPALAQSEQKEQTKEFRVYDVSDLLPEEVRAITQTDDTVTMFGPPMTVEVHRQDPTDIVFDLARTMSVHAIVFGPGVIGVIAEPAQQEAFAKALDALHNAFRDRVAVRIALYEVDAGADIAIGSRPNPDWGQPVRQIQQAIHRRVPTSMSSVTVRRYASDVNIFSGSGGFGYEPQMQNISEGLTLSVRVGAAKKDNGSLVDVRGALSRVAFREKEMQSSLNRHNAEAGEAVGQFELPTMNRRPIHSAVRLRDGVQTVIAVMDEPDADTVLVLTAKVSALP